MVLDGSQMPQSGLVLDGVEDFVDGEPERSSSDLSAQSGLGERIEGACLL